MRLVLWRSNSSASDVSTHVDSIHNMAGYSLLEKAVRAGLVKKKVMVHPSQGSLFYRDQWVAPNESTNAPKPYRNGAQSASVSSTPKLQEWEQMTPQEKLRSAMAPGKQAQPQTSPATRRAAGPQTSLFDVPSAAPVVSRLDEIKRRLTGNKSTPAAKEATPSMFGSTSPQKQIPASEERPVETQVEKPSEQPAPKTAVIFEDDNSKFIDGAWHQPTPEQHDALIVPGKLVEYQGTYSNVRGYVLSRTAQTAKILEVFVNGRKAPYPQIIAKRIDKLKDVGAEARKNWMQFVPEEYQAQVSSLVENISHSETGEQDDGRDHIRVNEDHHYENGKRVRGESLDATALEGVTAPSLEPAPSPSVTRLQETKRRLTDETRKPEPTTTSAATGSLWNDVRGDMGASEPATSNGVAPTKPTPSESAGSSEEHLEHDGTPAISGDGSQRSGGDSTPDVSANEQPVIASDESFEARGLRKERPRSSNSDYRLPDDIGTGSLAQKRDDNFAALDLLKRLNEDNRLPTEHEKGVLARYVGWGAFGQVFQKKFDEFYQYREGHFGELSSTRKPYDWTNADLGHYAVYKDLRSRMSDEDFDAARRSTLNAHYTAPQVVKAMWDAVRRIGFKRGEVLEPAMGTGNFFGFMPEDLERKSIRTGVELDPTTGKIARYLYPESDVFIKGFEEAPLGDDRFDLAISNVPFGGYGVHDPSFDSRKIGYLTKRIHNYFFAKSLDKVRPGGVVAFVTSHHTLDAKDSTVRDYLASKAHFLGAIRMPSDAFEENAGTKVTTDIIFLQKKDPEFEALHPRDAQGHFIKKWTETVGQKDESGQDFHLNEYFADHPEMLLGKMQVGAGLYRANDVGLVSDGRDLSQALHEAIAKLPEDVMHSYSQHNAAKEERRKRLADEYSNVKPGAFFLHEGEIHRHTMDAYGGSTMEKQEGHSAESRGRLTGMINLRNLAGELIQGQVDGTSPMQLAILRGRLQSEYDTFLKKYGVLHDPKNIRLFRDDPDAGMILALEEQTRDKDGKSGWRKADIFEKNTTRGYSTSQTADNVNDALGIVLNESGRVDWERLSEVMKRAPESIRDELAEAGRIFRDPRQLHDGSSDGWVTAEEYLSGNVRQKLRDAKAIAENDADFKPNVAALQAVQPEELKPSEIEARLGANWIPPDDIEKFLTHLLGEDNSYSRFDSRKPKSMVRYSNAMGRWLVEPFESGDTRRKSTLSTQKWGTEAVPALRILQYALDGQQPVVYYPKESDGSGGGVNQKSTQLAGAKLQEMRDEFRRWVWSDVERAERLVKIYNEKFNSDRLREYNGDHLTFPGLNAFADGGEVRQHIRDGVWRAIQDGKALFDHVVGAGKAQPLDAKVLTPQGWKLMGELCVGDEVIAGDGTSTRISGVYPQGNKEIFRVTFSDGSSTECCEEHLWKTQTYRERGYFQRGMTRFAGQVRSLGEIAGTLCGHRNAKNHSIPMVKAVQFTPRETQIHPYLLGVLLGDGGMSSKSAVFLSSVDDDILKMAADSLPDNLVFRKTSTKPGTCDYYLGLTSTTAKNPKKQNNSVVTALRELGLMGKNSHTKFVPGAYKFNSPEVRLGVLRGLMDTDGTVTKRGTSVVFYTVSPQLRDDVIFLVQSLGGTVRVTRKKSGYLYKGERRTGSVCYVLHLCMPPEINPFALHRKAVRVVPKSSYKPVRYITTVENVGIKPAQCIAVEHPEHLYVTDDFIVTHNTKQCVITAMELRRLGLAKKPMIAVPNNNIVQWSNDIRKYYPGAKVLTVWDRDWAPAKRKELTNRIATGDWDIVLITHSAFGQIPCSEHQYTRFFQEQKAELTAALEAEKSENSGKKSRSAKEMEKAIANIETKLKKRLAQAKKQKDNSLTWDQLGVDTLMVDEADLFKNLFFATRKRNVAGLNGTESGRATDMFIKSQHILEKHNDRGLYFATGTPISNSMAEMYTMQRYMAMRKLREMNLHHFDAWADNFGECTTAVEKTPQGTFRAKTRFAKFVNLPELITQYRSFADVRTREDLKHILPTPKIKGDGPQFHVAPMSEGLSGIMSWLQDRAEKVGKGDVDPSDDNMLAITTDARKASLDPRLINPSLPDDPDSKINRCVDNIVKIYHECHDHPKREELLPDAGPLRGTQLIFLDMSTPKGSSKEAASESDSESNTKPSVAEGEESENAATESEDTAEETAMMHSVYEDIKRKLVAQGMPAHEIAYATDFTIDAQRAERDRKMNSGELRVLIGSTSRMGAGLNVQNRLRALHHLDCPWRPRDVEQREGRIIRQGNMHETLGIPVEIHRYGTQGSFDENMWSTVARKARFIAQARTGKIAGRIAEDVDETVYTPQQFAAILSGNPLLQEQVQLEMEHEQLFNLRSAHLDQQYSASQKAAHIPAVIANKEEYAQRLEAAHAHYTKNKPSEFNMTVDGATHTKRESAGIALLEKARGLHGEVRREGPRKIGKYAGFDVEVHPSDNLNSSLFDDRAVQLSIAHPNGKTRSWVGRAATPAALTMKIDNALKAHGDNAARVRAEVEQHKRDLEGLQSGGAAFPHQRRLNEIEARLKEIDTILSADEKEGEKKDSEQSVMKCLEAIKKSLAAPVLHEPLHLVCMVVLPVNKSVSGGERPGHKYLSRKQINGEWVYDYGKNRPAPDAGWHARTAQLHQNMAEAKQARGQAEHAHGKSSVEYSNAKAAHGVASRRLAEHYAGVGEGEHIPLPYAHERYFEHTSDTQHVPLHKITPIRAREEGIANAEPLMRLAHEGIGGKREPISLEHNGDGTYSVKDGNSTFAIAQKHGWKDIPARVWEKGRWTDPKGEVHKSFVASLNNLRKALDIGNLATIPQPPVGNRAAAAVQFQGKGQYHYETGGGKRHRAPGARQKPVPQGRVAGTKIETKPPSSSSPPSAIANAARSVQIQRPHPELHAALAHQGAVFMGYDNNGSASYWHHDPAKIAQTVKQHAKSGELAGSVTHRAPTNKRGLQGNEQNIVFSPHQSKDAHSVRITTVPHKVFGSRPLNRIAQAQKAGYAALKEGRHDDFVRHAADHLRLYHERLPRMNEFSEHLGLHFGEESSAHHRDVWNHVKNNSSTAGKPAAASSSTNPAAPSRVAPTQRQVPQQRQVPGAPSGVTVPTGQKAYSSVRYPSPHEAHAASGPKATPNFAHHEMSLPGDHTLKQKTKDAEELYAHAGRHKEWLDTRLNRGKGLDKLFGFHVADGREATPEDYAKAHQKGGMIMLAPLKGQKRFHEKVNGKYGGDASRMRDVSRASVAVRNPDDIAHVTHALRKLGMTYASRPNDRFENPTPAGYGDVQLAPTDPHGHIGELQIHALDMLEAKEHGLDGGHSGHKLYERLREMDEADRDLTPDEKKERERIVENSQKLYGTASQRMKERPRLVPRPIPEGVGQGVEKSFVRGHFRKGKSMGKSTHPLGAGYFHYDGSLAKMESHAGRPKVWDGKEWKWVKDIGHFDHSAHRITAEEAEEIAREHGVKGAF